MQKKSVSDTTETPASKIKTGDLVVVKSDCPKKQLIGLMFIVVGRVNDTCLNNSLSLRSPLGFDLTKLGVRPAGHEEGVHYHSTINLALRHVAKVEDYDGDN